MTHQVRIGFIGLGEAGVAICRSLARRADVILAGHDALMEDRDGWARIVGRLGDGVHYHRTIGDLVRSSDYVFSLVTARAAVAVAEEAALHADERTTFLDANSTSPETARTASSAIIRSGARYLDLAVMGAISPSGHAVPMLVSGKGAEETAEALRSLGFDMLAIGTEAGAASAAKMMRSVIVKGVEALLLEALAASHVYGVTEHVLASLDRGFPEGTWAERADYFVSRTAEHGFRRADELDEAAEAVAAAGVTPGITRAAARRLRDAAVLLAGRGSLTDHSAVAALLAEEPSDA